MSDKKRTLIPDDYFEYSPIQVARFGKVVSMKNNMTTEQHQQFLRYKSEVYLTQIEKINALIKDIRSSISYVDPLELLKYAYEMFCISLVDVEAECQLSKSDIYLGRVLEYIQSVLGATKPNCYTQNDRQKDFSEEYAKLTNKIYELYDMTQDFWLYFVAHTQVEKPELDKDYLSFLIDAQAADFFRGDRYQVHEIPHIEELLLTHDDEIKKVFHFSANDLIEGLKNIQRALSKGSIEAMDSLEFLMDKSMEIFSKTHPDIDKVINEKEEINRIIENNEELKALKGVFCDEFFGMGKFDLSKLTNWNDEFLDKLSWSLGECESFFNRTEYPGWPIIDLPIYSRPFIKVNNIHYCFDYYNLFDHVYRLIQKAITDIDSDYKDEWNRRQSKATEEIVKKLFDRILPGCTTYSSNYYPIGKSLKQCAENDMLVIYDNNLIIIEVKGGSYTYTSPVLDIDSHISSLKALIGKADSQAERTQNYLKLKECAKLYDEQHNEKTEISYSYFDEVTKICISLDNFNEFSAQAEKLKFLKMNNNTIAIALDDFRAYADLFDSPCIFLHFLKQRKLATTSSRIALNDELDHYGMYVEHNNYSITANKYEASQVFWHGYRENLDRYFANLFYKDKDIEKPKQELPRRIEEIIAYLDKNDLPKKIKLANFLLDMSGDARVGFCDNIDRTLLRQKETMKMTIISSFGDVRFSICCHHPIVKDLSEQYVNDYALSAMLNNNEDTRLVLHLFYNNDSSFEKLLFNFFDKSDIPQNREKELEHLAEIHANSRIVSYKNQHGNAKIGPNMQCPCGSGKKYKKCHGKV